MGGKRVHAGRSINEKGEKEKTVKEKEEPTTGEIPWRIDRKPYSAGER